MTEQEIRSDWAAALRSVKYGYELSKWIHYGFYDEDIVELAKLHKRNRFAGRSKIFWRTAISTMNVENSRITITTSFLLTDMLLPMAQQ